MKMKSMLLISALSVLISSPANANGVCGKKCGWYLDLEPFYLRATDTLLTNSMYAVKVADPNIQGDNKELYHLHLDDSFGGRIALGYDFPNCFFDCYYGLSLEYTYFHHDDDARVDNEARNSQGVPVLAPAEFIDLVEEANGHYAHASSRLEQNYDTVDFLVHKNILFCNCTDLQVFAGARYLHLREDLHNHYLFSGDIMTNHIDNNYDIHFRNDTDNVGPEVGASIFYNIADGLGITGQLAASLLFGESKSRFNNFFRLLTVPSGSTEAPTVTLLTSANHVEDSAHVIPALSGKIGLAYKRNFCRCSSFTVEIGYRGDRYFNAVNDVAYQQLLLGDDANSTPNYQDFDLTGPYFRLTLHA